MYKLTEIYVFLHSAHIFYSLFPADFVSPRLYFEYKYFYWMSFSNRYWE